MDINQLLQEAENEINGMSDDEKRDLASGYDNRGLDCISQRWYGPERLRGGSLEKLGSIILDADNLLRDKLEGILD